MSNNCFLEKIKSKFIIERIIEYTSDYNEIYKLKLFKYSKLFHKKLNINQYEYKYHFLIKRFKYYRYLEVDFDKIKENKNYLNKEIEEKLKSLNLTISEAKNILNKFEEIKKDKKMKNEVKEENEDYINNSLILKYDIFSPFIEYEISYNNDIFINIPLNYIEKYSLYNDYISFFLQDDLSKYTLYISFSERSQIKILKQLKINFSISKVLVFYEENEIEDNYSFNDNNNNFKDNEFLFKEIFSLNIFENNLQTLCLELKESTEIKNNIFELLNKLDSLKNLEFKYLKFSPDFSIKLKQLELIYFVSCGNIYFNDEYVTKNIKVLKLEDTIIKQNKEKYKFPSLECLYIDNSIINLDFSSFKKLKKLEFDNKLSILESINNFAPIESVTFLKFFENNELFEEEEEDNEEKENLEEESTNSNIKRMIEICLENKNLKNIEIFFHEKLNQILNEIKGNNESTYSLHLTINKANDNINNFIKRFPNLKKRDIFSNISNKNFCYEIKYDKNINIEEIDIFMGLNTILYCNFEKIKILSLDNKENFTTKSFPLFNMNCDYFFKSLRKLSISSSKKNEYEIIKNLYNNIDKCQNLEKLSIDLINIFLKVNRFF